MAARASGSLAVEELEARLLFSADLAPSAGIDAALVAQHRDDEEQQRVEIAFVDAGLDNVDGLLAALRQDDGEQRSLQIVMLDPERDGIAQVSEALAQYEDLSAIHLFTHGDNARLALGSTTLDAAALQARSGEIAHWGDALASDADLLIYGCDVAEDEAGQAFVRDLAALTGVDVAASDDVTGATALGGDWDLEYQVGQIDARNGLAQAQSATWQGVLALTAQGGETRVNTATTGTQSTTTYGAGNVAMDTNGNTVVVWNDGNTGDVYFQRYDGSGNALGSNTRANTTTANLQSEAQVAMDGNGNFVVAWMSASQDGSGDGIYAQRFNASGVAQGGEFRVNTTTANNQGLPAVAMDASGNFVVTWTDAAADGSSFGVYAQRYDAAGSAQGGQFRVNTTTTNAQSYSVIAMNATGSFVIAWESSQTGDNDIYFQRYSAAGSTVGAETRVNATTFGTQWNAAVAIDDLGNFVVAWEDAQGADGGTNGIFARRFDVGTGSLGSEFRVNTTTNDAQTVPAIAMNGAGDFLVAWNSANQDTNARGVYAQQYSAGGAASGGEFRVNTTITGDQQMPSVAFVGSRAVVAWSGNGTGDSSGVFMQRYASPIAPVNTVPAAQTTNEDTALFISTASGNQISISDADAGGANNEVTLSVTNGTLTLAGTAGLTFVTGNGTANATMTFRGTAAAINTALDGLSYSPAANYNGGATLTLTTRDDTLVTLDADASLRGLYTFENTGALGADTSPAAGNSATVNGATAVVNGTRGNVAGFDGNDNLQISGLFGNPANATLAAWVDVTGVDTSAGTVITLGNSLNLLVTTTQVVASWYNGSTFNQVAHNTSLIGAGWHHLAVSFDDSGNLATLYLDGTARTSTATADSIVYNQGANSFIGKHGNGGSTWDYSGRIDDARAHDRALTSSEISTLASDLPLTDTDVVAITVTAVNDAPVNVMPANAYTALDTAKVFSIANGNALQISDVDAASGTMQFTLTASQGTLSLASTTGLTLAGGANGSASFTYTGTLSAINSALGAGVSFTPASGFRGLATLNLQSSDLGNTGSGGTKTDSDTLNLHVGAIVVTNASDTSNGTTTSIANLIANDGGDGISLREAISAANATAGLDYILFDIGGGGTQTISLSAALPAITQAVHIDGSSQAGYAGTPLIVVNGAGASGTTTGFNLGTGSGGSTIRGLQIVQFSGYDIYITSNGNTIAANYIGTDGSNALGNARAGVYLDSTAADNLIGGTAAGSGNVIANSGWDGIRLNGTGTGNAFLGNSIYGNVEQGIDIGTQGVTANDFGDADTGSNNVQNFPVLATATTDVGTVIAISGTLNSTANSYFRIEFFTNTSPDGTGYGEGQTYLGFVNVATDGAGNANIDATLAADIAGGAYISATATNSDSSYATFTDTSEFAAVIVANDPPTDIVFDSDSGSEVVVNSYTTTDQIDPAIAAFADGGYVVVWVSNGQDGSGYGIYGQRYSADGSANGAEFLVASEVTDAETNPSVTTFADGGFAVAWQDQISGVRAWTEARLFNADGSPATSEFALSPGTDGDNEGYQPALLALSDSEFVAVWANETAGTGYDVVGQRYDRAGATVGGQFTIGSLASGTGLFGAQTELALLDDGGFVAVWRTHDGTNTAVAARVMNADGSARSSIINPGGDNIADVAGLSNGGFVLTYDDAGALKATIYDAGGAVVASEFQVNTTTSSARYESTVIASDDGLVVVWESSSGDGSGTAILAQRFDAGGSKIGGEVVVNGTTAGDQKKPEVAVTAAGRIVAVWQSDNLDGDATGIAMRLVTTGTASVPENSPNGTRVADVIGVMDLDAGDTHTFDLTDDAGGRFAIDANTGVITVANGLLLDFETDTSHTVTVRVTDSAASSYSEVLTIAVEDVADTNSAPSFGATLDGNPTFVEGGAAVVLDTNVDVSDTELDALNGGNGNYAGASLTLERNGGADADDTFGFSDGNGISLSAANLVKNGQIVATFDTTGTSGQLAIVFTDGNGEIPTSADVDNILRQITYVNGSDAPPASVQIDWTFDDGNSGAQGSGGALQALGSTTVNITGVNDAPSGSANTISATEDTAYTFAVADFGFSDIDGHNLLRVWIDTLPGQGQLLWNGGTFAAGNWIDAGDISLGLLTYEPPAGASGASLASFTFRVQDDGGTANGGQDTEAAANTMTIDVAAANPPMSATDDFLSTLEDTPLVFDPTSNDVASQGGAVTVVEFTQPTNGAVVDNGDGTLTYTPDPGYTGGDSFDYVIVDADANATLSHYWNLDGTATDGVGTSDGTLNGTTTVAGSIGNGLSFNESSDYVQIPDITYGAEFTISFDFRLDDNTGSLFQYLYSHGDVGGFNSVNVFVNEASHGTDPNVLRTVIRDGDDSLDNFALQFDISSIVGDGQWHTYTATVDSGGIKVYLDGNLKMTDATRGTGGVNPTGDLYVGGRQDLDADRYYGGALDSLRIYDSALVDSDVAVMANSSTGTVNITVDPVSNATPVANPDAITVAEGGTATSLDSAAPSVLANDTGLGDTPVTVSLITDVTFGSLTLNPDGTFSYTHDGSENFTDSFTYRVTDNDGDTSDATVSITITPVSDTTPVANADAITVAEGGTATTLDTAATSVLANDTGLGDTPVTVSLVSDVTRGSLTLNADGTFSYTHDGSENFSDSFTYRVTDNDGQTSDATVSITITPVSDTTPVANADAITVAEGGTATTLDSAASSVLANDTGLGDTPVTVSLVSDVTNGSLTLNADGTFSYTHDGSENFSDSFTYRVTDNDGQTSDATVSITITPVSDTTPVANADAITVAEGGTATTLDSAASSVLANDAGLGDTPVTVSLVSGVTHGSLTFNADGTFNYTHDGSENFSDSFTYRVTDNDGQTSDATVSITITPVSDTTPVANADAITVAEGGTATALDSAASSVLANDAGLGDTPVTVSLLSDVTNGSLTLNADGTFSYTHDGTENFSDSFTYRVTDNDGQTSDATVSITITPVSDTTPVANADAITVAEGGTATTLDSAATSVLANDTGLSDTPVTVSLVSDVTNGTLTLNADGTFSYTHDGSENFSDSFTYRVTDNDGQTSDATVSITITPVSDATPVANADAITVAEGGTATTLDTAATSVLANDAGLGDTPVTVSLVSDVTNGSLTLNADGTFSYTHDGSENFSDSFTYRVTDNDGQTSDATVSITITPVSDTTPVANADAITVAEGGTATALDSAVSSVLANDAGLGDTPVTVSLLSDVTNGSLTLNADGTFSYTHDGSENFSDSFTYRVTDNDGQTSDATVSITITPVSDATPVANADAITVAEGGTATVLDSAATSVLANDTGLGDTPVTVSLVSDVTNGTLTLNADGTFSYTHDGSENFSDSFTYRVTDNDGQTSDATVSITITPVSDTTPVANADAITVAEGGTATTLDSAASSVLANDAGLGDTPVTVTLVSDVTHGTLALNADGTFSFTHDGSENFSDSFTYRVTDNDGQTSDATVSITITPVSDATPVANADAITVAEGGTATTLDSAASSVLANDAGLGDTPVTVSLVSDVTNGSLTLNADGTFSYTHDGTENFSDSFTYRVTDNDGQTSDATVSITITPVSDTTPVANADAITVAEGGTATALDSAASSVLANDAGLGDTPVTVSLLSDVTNGSLTLNADGTFSYTHDGTENFSDSFTYRVTDNDGQTSDATVSITITPVSDTTPVANADAITVAEGGTATTLDSAATSVLANDTGLSDTPVTVSLVSDVTNGTLTLNADGTFSYTHDGSESFTDAFTYRVTDLDGESSDATVTITITPVSDTTPVANADAITVAEGGTATTLDSAASSVLANDTGLGDTPVTVSLVSGVTHGSLTLNADGTFSYTHDGSENFSDAFTYRVTDNDGQTSDATVSITITPVSDTTPVANADAITVAEGGTATALDSAASSVLANDAGLADTPVTVSLVSDVTHGTLTLSPDGTFSYTHDGSANYTDAFTYRVTDNDGETSDAIVSITVTPVSSTTPAANPDAITVAEGGTATTLDSTANSVLANDTGLADTPVTVSLVSDVTNGTLTLNADGTFSYTHDGTENFTDAFTYRVTDLDGESSDATVTITITPVSDATPVANADSITVAEGGTATTLDSTASSVLANDTGLGDTPVTVSLVTDVTQGSLTLNADGTFSYTHDGSENFSDSFTYRVTDNDGQTSDATVSIAITPVSDATPVGNADAITVAEGGTATTLDSAASSVLANDTGLGDTPVAVSLVSGVTNGSLTLNADGTFSYTHDGSENFSDSFTYRVTDNDGETSDATVSITITPVSDTTPVANADAITVAEGGTATTLDSAANSVLANDTGLADTPVTVSLVSDVTYGTLTLNADGTFSYTHDGTENFTDAFTYRVTDLDGESSDATVTITITPVSDTTPVANADAITVAEGGTATTLDSAASSVLANDTGLGDTPVTVSLVTDVTHGSLTLNADGTFNYTHDGSENFSDSFTYRVTDNDGQTSDATASITITPVSDATPVANADSITVAEGGTATALDSAATSVLANDAGLADTPVTVSLVSDVTHGTLTLNADGTFSYTHDGSANYTDAFTYRVTDNDGETSDAIVSITVTPVSSTTPAANPDAITVAEGGTATTLDSAANSVLANDTGLADTPVTVSLVSDVTYGTLTLNADGTFSYTHDGTENFTDAFTYRVTDLDGESSDATVTITITPVSDTTPVANADAITVAEGGTATALDSAASSVLANDAGLADTPVTVSLVSDVTHGTLTLNADGTFSYTHDGSANYTDAFTYRVTDNDGETSDAIVSITVTPVSSTTPAANPDAITVAEGGTATTLDSAANSVLANDTGLADTPVTVSLVSDVTHGTLTLNADGTFTYTHDGSANHADFFAYRVTDNDGQTSGATVIISVATGNRAPTIDSSAMVSVTEHTIDVLTVRASDPDGSANIRFAISGGGDADRFAIDPVTGKLSFVDAPDFERPGDADSDNVYAVEVRASDGSLSASQTILVTVTDANDAPTAIGLDGSTITDGVDTGSGLAVGRLSVIDQDASDSHAYSIIGGADRARFGIGGAGDLLTMVDGRIDSQRQSSYEVIVRVTDEAGASHDQRFLITVAASNRAPVFLTEPARAVASGAEYRYEIRVEDGDGDTPSILAATLPEWMRFVDRGDGTALLSGTPDDGRVGTWQILLSASDGEQVTLQAFELVVLEANHAPTIVSYGGLDSAVVQAGSGAGFESAVLATDPDIGDQLRYEIAGGEDAGAFVLDPATGVLRFVSPPDASVPADANGDNIYRVVIQVSDLRGAVDVQALSIRISLAVEPIDESANGDGAPAIDGVRDANPGNSSGDVVADEGAAEDSVRPDEQSEATPAIDRVAGDAAFVPGAGHNPAVSRVLESATKDAATPVRIAINEVSAATDNPAGFEVLNWIARGLASDAPSVASATTATPQLTLPDEVVEQLEQAGDEIQFAFEQVALSGVVLTVGVVWWASRIGALVAGVMVSVPAWRSLDPLAVLWEAGEDRDEEEDELPAEAIDATSRGAAGAQRP